jgi:hypothetical protein
MGEEGTGVAEGREDEAARKALQEAEKWDFRRRELEL